MTHSIHGRIDRLIEKCDFCNSDSIYDEIIFEMDELLMSLLGEKHNSYKNFMYIYRARDSWNTKCAALKGVLQGVKAHLELADRKYQVFISSTFKDLIDYRKTVADEIAFRGHIPAGMEDFTACGEDLETYIKGVIDNSDYCVLLLGQRFGSHIPGNEDVSYTMMEYEYAKSKGIRIIPFIYNGEDTLSGNDLEAQRDRFDRFVSAVSKTVPQYFADKNELSRKLTKAFENEFKNHPQKGWIRL